MVLLNADVVLIICESLDQKDLTVLARTARFLHDPVLRVLWRDIKKFSHLLSLFGSSVIQNHGTICLSDTLTSTQWDRFKFHAQFVRNLCIPYDERIELSSLVMLLPHQPLLPRLLTLEVQSWPEKGYHLLSMFFIPSIQKFTIDNSRDLLAMDQLITVLGNTAPALQDLGFEYLGTFTEGNEAPGEFGVSISIFHNLCSINIPLTGLHVHAVLSHLSTLPELSTLRFYITGLASVSDSDSKYSFPAARSLSLMSDSDDHLLSFMALPSFSNLTNLKMHCISYQMDDETLFKAISVSCGQFLNKIEIVGDIESYDAFFPIFYPLFKFTNLRSFSLLTQEPFWPTDEDIQNIIKSWPNLEQFLVCPMSPDECDFAPSPLTWAALLLLIDKCINLKEISIAVNSLIQKLPNVTSPIRRPELAIKLEPALSLIDSPRSLAGLLDLALPDADISIRDYGASHWVEVQELLALQREKLQMASDEGSDVKPRGNIADMPRLKYVPGSLDVPENYNVNWWTAW